MSGLFLHALPFAKIALDYIAPLALFGGVVGLVMLSLGILPGWGALLPAEQRLYLNILAKRKRKKCRQKGVKKVNKIGLFTLLLVVGNVVLAMLAQSASNGGARSNSNAHSAVDANATTLCEPETEVSSDSGFFTTIHVKNYYLTRPPPSTSSCSLAPSSSFR